MHKVSVLIGSLRADSNNRRLAHALERLARGRLAFDYPDLDLPLYNDDLWADPPAGVRKLKRSLDSADGVLFVTPEYNRSFTPAIKNAIDWGSRPWGESSWSGKPAAIVGAAGGKVGTAAAQAQLRSVVSGQGTILLTQPEVYLEYRSGLIDDDGRITDPDTEKFLAAYVDKLVAWIERMSTPAVRDAAA